MIGIYKITNNVNGKCYIGKSEVSIDSRLKYHKSLLDYGNHYNKHFQNSYIKYNGNFSFEVLEELQDRNLCCDREKYWISYYHADNPQFGYNMTIGGEAGCKPEFVTAETRAKISAANKGNKNWLGKHHTEETKKKIGLVHKNKIVSEETRKKISEKAKLRDFTYLKEFNTGREFSEEHRQHIRDSISPLCGRYERTDEWKSKISEIRTDVNSGRIWVNNGKKNKFVYPDAIPEGYIKGRMVSNSSKIGKKMINNGIINKQVNSEEVDDFLKQGWFLGRLKKVRNNEN